MTNSKTNVAVVGIGAMGRGLIPLLNKTHDIQVVAIADKNPKALENIKPLLSNKIKATTNAQDVFNSNPDILIDATDSVYEAAVFINHALEHKIHVIMLNSYVDQTFGRLLAKKAEENGVILTSDAGDQDGVLIRTINDIHSMGFQIVMAGNNKGFLERYANPESIKEEAEKRCISTKQCTAFTDGTKLAMEMALVANTLNLDILQEGMTGPRIKNVQDVLTVFDLDKARELGGVVDYVLGAEPGGSVFVIGYSNDENERFYMNYYKMGEGPYYVFVRPYHLCHFETPIAIQRIMNNNESILVQKKRVLEVGCRAKTNLKSETKLDGIGGHHIYGILEKPGNLPIGLVEGTTLKRSKKKDEVIGWDDVEFKDNDPRLNFWKEQTKLEA
ncbi:Gfo/Idh/MocA family oxidoreductase [Thermoproteota archaeon]